MEEKILFRSDNGYTQKMMLKSIICFVICLAASFFWLNFGWEIAVTSFDYELGLWIVCSLLGISLCFLIFFIAIKNTRIVVSNKRVSGATFWGKLVDLPLDSISAVGVSAFKGIAIGTSSGRISFKGIGNNNEIYKVISELLIDRQKKGAENKTGELNADELKKFKELLDSGIITQEEFDAKKKQLLGL